MKRKFKCFFRGLLRLERDALCETSTLYRATRYCRRPIRILIYSQTSKYHHHPTDFIQNTSKYESDSNRQHFTNFNVEKRKHQIYKQLALEDFYISISYCL